MESFTKVTNIRKMRHSKLFWITLFVFVASIVSLSVGQSRAAEPYYKGKTVTLISNFQAGGAVDNWARLQARHISRFLPGQPTVIVQNMVGATGITGFQYIMKTAEPDGLTIGCIGGSLASNEAVGNFPPGTPSFKEASIIASLADPDITYGRKVVFPQGYKNYLSLTKRPIIIANLKRDDEYARDRAIMTMFGLKGGSGGGDYKQVVGYPGSPDVNLAMGRGEADQYTGRVAGYFGAPIREVQLGNWVPLYQGGVIDASGQCVRSAAVKDVPTVYDVVLEFTGKHPSGPYYEFLQWTLVGKTANRIIAVRPGTPSEITTLLSQAWTQMAKDPQFLDEQGKVFGSKEQNLLFGEAARRQVLKILEMPKVVSQAYDELISE